MTLCLFCKEEIIKTNGKDSDSPATHHIDGNPENDVPENRMTVHFGCHSKHHNKNGSPGSWLGKKFSEEHRQNLSKAHMGIRPSAETRKKLSASRLGRKLSSITREKIRKTHLGMRHSLETKQKMSLSQRRRRLLEKKYKIR